MDTAILFLSLSILFLRACGQEWTCPSAEKCSLFIKKQLNLTESSSDQNVTIDVCLNKQADILQCINGATDDCNFQGVEPEFNRLLRERRAVKLKCNALCSNLEEIRGCAEKISYTDYTSQRYDDYCRSYHESLKCKNDTLSENPCSFGEQLFQIGFDENIVRIFRYMCYPGCNNVTAAWQVLENCTRTWKLTEKNCRAYIGLENCLTSHNTCSQIKQMVPYFSPMYEELHISCKGTTSATETTTLGGEIVNRCLAPLTFSVVVSNATICTAVKCLKMDGMTLAYLSSLRVKESILKLLQEGWINCSQKTQYRTTILTVLQTTVKPHIKNGTMATNDITEYFTDGKAVSENQSYSTNISTTGASADPKVNTTTAHSYVTESTTLSEKRGYSPSISTTVTNKALTTNRSMNLFKQYTLEQNETRTADSDKQDYSPNKHKTETTVDTTEIHRTLQSQTFFTSKVTRHLQPTVISGVSSPASSPTVPSPVPSSVPSLVPSAVPSSVPSPATTKSSTEKISFLSTTEKIQKEENSPSTPILKTTTKTTTTTTVSNLGIPEGQSKATHSFPVKPAVLFPVLICAFIL